MDALVADVIAAPPPRLRMPPPIQSTGIVSNEWSPTPSPPPQFHPGVQSSITVHNILVQLIAPPMAFRTENTDDYTNDDDCIITGCTPPPQ